MVHLHRIYNLQSTYHSRVLSRGDRRRTGTLFGQRRDGGPLSSQKALPPFYRALDAAVALTETCILWMYAVARLTETPIGDVLSWDTSTLMSAVVVYRWDAIVSDAYRLVQTPPKERAGVRAEVLRKGDDGKRAVRLARRLRRQQS